MVDVEQHRVIRVVGEFHAVAVEIEDQRIDVNGAQGLLGDVIEESGAAEADFLSGNTACFQGYGRMDTLRDQRNQPLISIMSFSEIVPAACFSRNRLTT